MIFPSLFYMQAIDPRTRMVLFRMLNRGVFDNINGCISTGKEVNFSLQFILHYMFFCYLPVSLHLRFMEYMATLAVHRRT